MTSTIGRWNRGPQNGEIPRKSSEEGQVPGVGIWVCFIHWCSPSILWPTEWAWQALTEWINTDTDSGFLLIIPQLWVNGAIRMVVKEGNSPSKAGLKFLGLCCCPHLIPVDSGQNQVILQTWLPTLTRRGTQVCFQSLFQDPIGPPKSSRKPSGDWD